MKPKVSIIIPVYNVEQYLERCLQSVLAQTLDGLEIIMVDDGSSDNSSSICDDYANHYSNMKVIHKQNGGLSYARNSGLEIATGEYVAFVDSDDFVDYTMYEKLYKSAQKEDADLVLCGYNRIHKDSSIQQYFDVTDVHVYQGEDCVNILKAMIGKSMDSQFNHFDYAVWHGLYRNDLIQKNSIRFLSEREILSEDIMFHVHFLPFCSKIVSLPDCLYNYCLNDNSITTKYKPGKFNYVLNLYDKIFQHLKMAGIFDEEFEFRMNYFILDMAINIISYEMKYNNSGKKNQEVKSICNDVQVQKSIANYPISKLCFKHYLLLSCVRMKFVIGLYVLFSVKKLLK